MSSQPESSFEQQLEYVLNDDYISSRTDTLIEAIIGYHSQAIAQEYEQGRRHEILTLLAAIGTNTDWRPEHFAGALRSRLSQLGEQAPS